MAKSEDQAFELIKDIGRILYELTRVFVYMLSSLAYFAGLAVRKSVRHEEVTNFDRERRDVESQIQTLTRTVRAHLAAAQSVKRDEFDTKLWDKINTYAHDRNARVVSNSLISAYFDFAWELFQSERLDIIEPPNYTDEVEKGKYLDYLVSHAESVKEPQVIVDDIVLVFALTFYFFAKEMPPLVFTSTLEAIETSPIGTVVLSSLLDHLDIDQILRAFFTDVIVDRNMLREFRNKLQENKALAGDKPIPIRQMLGLRLKDTKLRNLFDTEIPFDIPIRFMLEHSILVAGAGHGKTQTLGALIARHLKSDNPPAMVVIDSTGALVKKIQTLSIFLDKLRDRLLIIDPEHNPVPSLNMFDISSPRFQSYSLAEREAIETEIVNLFSYIFSSIDNPLTDPMRTTLYYVIRLLMTIPKADITTLRILLEENSKVGYQGTKFKNAIDAIDPDLPNSTTRAFFQNQFFTERVASTKGSLLQRLSSILSVPAFERMFSNSNKVDFYDELQTRGSIIVVNTSEKLLKESGSPLFGRYIIARTMAAAFERASIPENQRRPTLLIVDEAAPYFDDTFDKLLTRVRQFKLGVLVAFQHMEQASEKLKSAIASNTSVKIAGGLGFADSRWLARDMETEAEFLKGQKRDERDPPQWTSLACYVRNYTPNAVSIRVPFFALENMPQMSAAEYASILRSNRYKVSEVGPDEPDPNGPRLNPRPKEMEKWRLDSADKRVSTPKPNEDDDGSDFRL